MKPTPQDLAKINSRLPGTELTAEQVEVLPFRAFDNNVTDRYTVMTPEMMNAVVRDANNGMLAMNSMHQSRYTLPAGRSIEGRVVGSGRGNSKKEVQIKMYAVTQRPDGSPMEDGKDLADRYNTGAVYACSLGVNVGKYECNICGNDIRDYRNCDHYPGEMYITDNNKPPVQCLAYMTGHQIVEGPNGPEAVDCGAYELSAVTAGGVRNAGVLSQTFSAYDGTGDIKEFKKGAFEGKTFSECVEFFPGENVPPKQGEASSMSQSNTFEEKYVKVVGDHATLTAEHGTLKASYSVLEADHKIAAGKIEEYTKTNADLTAKIDEYAKTTADLTAKAAEYETQVQTLTTEKSGLEAFRAAYIELVKAEGIKVDATVDGYENLELSKLQELYTAHHAAVAALPAGQHSTAEGIEGGESTYAGIPDTLFKSR